MGAWRMSAATEEALWAAAKEQLGDGVVRQKILLPAIARRSALYTTERDDDGGVAALTGTADLGARALFFTLADAAKIKIPIAELANRDALPARESLRVLDLGAGCGAMTFGLCEALSERSLEVVGIDRDSDALAIFSAAATRLSQAGNAELSVETRAGDVMRPPNGPWDLIVCGSVLNELTPKSASKLVTLVVEQLAEDGAIIIIEPALRDTSRRLHQLRDRIIEAGLGHVFAPCTKRSSPCPALTLDRDWCHEDRPFEPTPRLASLTNATGMRARHLKFSYLVVRKQPQSVATNAAQLRVVSSLKKSKGKLELYACGEGGRELVRLQKRDIGDDNRELRRAKRGQLLVIEGTRAELDDPAGRPS